MGPISLQGSLTLEVLSQLPRESEGDVTTEEWSRRCNVAGFEDGGRGPQAKGCVCPLEAGKAKGTDSPTEH